MKFIALLLGAIYWQIPMDQAAIMNINGALFLLLTNLNFQNAFGVVNVINCSFETFYANLIIFSLIKTFCVELPIFQREHNNGMYRVSSYFLSKMIAEVCSLHSKFQFISLKRLSILWISCRRF